MKRDRRSIIESHRRHILGVRSMPSQIRKAHRIIQHRNAEIREQERLLSIQAAIMNKLAEENVKIAEENRQLTIQLMEFDVCA